MKTFTIVYRDHSIVFGVILEVEMYLIMLTIYVCECVTDVL